MDYKRHCQTCILWDGVHCRRHAPTIITLVEGEYGAVESKPWSGWPLAAKDDWCGEWEGS